MKNNNNQDEEIDQKFTINGGGKDEKKRGLDGQHCDGKRGRKLRGKRVLLFWP